MNRSCRTSVTDCAAELRARAEKARVEAAGVPYGDDDYLYGYAAAYDEAASLVEALRSPTRADLIERLEKDAADWEGASEIFKPTPSLLREAASTLQAYEKALREIADYHADPVPLARATLKGEKNG